MMWILQLLGLIPAALNTVDGITKAIASERLAQISAKTQEEQIHATERVASLTARRDVLVAEAPTPSGIWNARMRTLLAVGPMSILLKLMLWDKVIGSFAGCSGKNTPASCSLFVTDPLDANQWYVILAAVCFYFAADAYAGR